MLISKCLVVALIVVSVATEHLCGRKSKASGLIVGGAVTSRNEWPWLAALMDVPTQKLFCGSTIISEMFVITAAHCIQPKGSQVLKRADEVVALLGKHNISSAYERDIQPFYPTEIFVHPDWNIYSERYDADLAILRSETPIRFNNKIKAVCLWSGDENENVEGIVAGWGRSEVSSLLGHEEVPRGIKVRRIPSLKCYEDYHPFATIASSRTFCGGGVVENTGPCSGDSGGGFFTSTNNVWYVEGIVSASFFNGEMQCDVSKNTVFTKLSAFKYWINEKIGTSSTEAPSKIYASLDRSSCSSIDNLYASEFYVKTLCTMQGRVSFDEAKGKCRNAGMQLFAVRTADQQTAFIGAIKRRFRKSSSVVGWLNGERNALNKWVSYDPEEAPIYRRLKWGDSNTISGRWLKYEKHSGSSYFSSSSHPLPDWTFCQFIDDAL